MFKVLNEILIKVALCAGVIFVCSSPLSASADWERSVEIAGYENRGLEAIQFYGSFIPSGPTLPEVSLIVNGEILKCIPSLDADGNGRWESEPLRKPVPGAAVTVLARWQDKIRGVYHPAASTIFFKERVNMEQDGFIFKAIGRSADCQLKDPRTEFIPRTKVKELFALDESLYPEEQNWVFVRMFAGVKPRSGYKIEPESVRIEKGILVVEGFLLFPEQNAGLAVMENPFAVIAVHLPENAGELQVIGRIRGGELNPSR